MRFVEFESIPALCAVTTNTRMGLMRESMLRLNFFTVWLPDDALPFLVRDRLETTKLEYFEREFILTPSPTEAGAPKGTPTSSRVSPLAVAVGPFSEEFQPGVY